MWPTYGWGSLEYSSGAGAVLGGRWKPSHYFLKRAYASFYAACGSDGRCFAKNDDPLRPFNGTLALALLNLRTGAAAPVGAPRALALPRGAGALQFLCLDPTAPAPCGAPTPPAAAAADASCSSTTPNTDVEGVGGSSVPAGDAAACCTACAANPACARAVQFQGTCWMKNAGGATVPKAGATLVVPPGNAPPCPALSTVLAASGCAPDGTDCALIVNGEVQLLAPPGALALESRVAVEARVGAGGGAGDALAPIDVVLTAAGGGGGPALFVTLFTAAQGRFSDNAVVVPAGEPVTLQFVPFVEGQGGALRDTLRVDFLNKYVL